MSILLKHYRAVHPHQAFVIVLNVESVSIGRRRNQSARHVQRKSVAARAEAIWIDIVATLTAEWLFQIVDATDGPRSAVILCTLSILSIKATSVCSKDEVLATALCGNPKLLEGGTGIATCTARVIRARCDLFFTLEFGVPLNK